MLKSLAPPNALLALGGGVGAVVTTVLVVAGVVLGLGRPRRRAGGGGRRRRGAGGCRRGGARGRRRRRSGTRRRVVRRLLGRTRRARAARGGDQASREDHGPEQPPRAVPPRLRLCGPSGDCVRIRTRTAPLIGAVPHAAMLGDAKSSVGPFLTRQPERDPTERQTSCVPGMNPFRTGVATNCAIACRQNARRAGQSAPAEGRSRCRALLRNSAPGDERSRRDD